MNSEKVHIVTFMGAPGVGKTTLAERLAQGCGMYFFQREVVLDSIFDQERDTPRYNELAEPITKSTFQLAMYNAKLGVSSITEAPLKPAIQGKTAGFIDDTLKAGKEHGFQVDLIYCVAPAETVLAYLKKRGSPRNEQKYSADPENGWPWFLRTFIDVPGPTQYEHLRVETQLPVEENLGKIIAYLER